MRPLRYSINVTLDGVCDHRAMPGDVGDAALEELHQQAAATLARADALLFGRVTYTMMEEAFRAPRDDDPFARTIDAARKYVVSSTLPSVGWNAELVHGDLADAVRRLKEEPGDGLLVGGVQLPQALAELGLIDEYELVVHPRVAGAGRRLFDGLARPLDLELVDRVDYASGAVALRYVPRR
ncbi:dihydrofolate reductase family protein [Nocardioides sp. R1-1]|uniref:dihydrofolate reductase family protein n=1 Tax=Nocardioides sp. R1-1 TaxID=3383502 RepID=UPI0038D08024